MSNIHTLSAQTLERKIAKGWKPHQYLTNMSVAHFQPGDWFVSPFIFPFLPVQTSIGNYYVFNKGDLARDNVRAKPKFGKVTPMTFGTSEATYRVDVDQVIIGLDQIGTLDWSRGGTPGINDPRRAKVRIATEQMALHADLKFADGFFKSGIWTNEWTGVTANPTGKQFHKFSDPNFDPISFFGARRTEMMKEGRRKPNVLALGVDAYEGLKQNPDLLERVKYGGSTPNPANVNTNVLAQLLEFERVSVLNSTYNAAKPGEADDMQFVCDPTGALIAYAAPNPAVDEVSAGYTITWDMLGNGQHLAFDQWEGEPGTHTEFIEGLMSMTPKKVCDELGVFLTGCA